MTDTENHPPHDDDAIAMQVRCVWCFKEQYALAVMAVSYGEAPCVWCHRMSVKMTLDQYRSVLAERRRHAD